jgi:predicted nucleic acid-binding protein
MTISKSKVYVDTNILVYANTQNEPFSSLAMNKLQELLDNDNELLLSQQTLREYANVTLRNAIYHKYDLRKSITMVLSNIMRFQRDFTLINESPKSLQNWLALLPQLTTGKDVFDFNSVAMLQVEGITHIFTHNTSDFTKFSSWLTVIPLISP